VTVPVIVPELAAAVRASAFFAEPYAFWADAAVSITPSTTAAVPAASTPTVGTAIRVRRRIRRSRSTASLNCRRYTRSSSGMWFMAVVPACTGVGGVGVRREAARPAACIAGGRQARGTDAPRPRVAGGARGPSRKETTPPAAPTPATTAARRRRRCRCRARSCAEDPAGVGPHPRRARFRSESRRTFRAMPSSRGSAGESSRSRNLRLLSQARAKTSAVRSAACSPTRARAHVNTWRTYRS
jgi:hypothetical protein